MFNGPWVEVGILYIDFDKSTWGYHHLCKALYVQLCSYMLCHSPAVLPVLRAAGWFCPGKTCSWMCPEPLGSWSPCSHHAWVSSLLGGDSPTLFVAPFFGFLTVCAIQIAHIFIESYIYILYMHYLYQYIYIYSFQNICIHSVDCWTPQ